MKTTFAALALLATAALPGCASPAEPPPAGAATSPGGAQVEVVNIAFRPATLKVLRGTEVTWTNADDQVRHTVTSGSAGDNGIPGVSTAAPNDPDGTFDGDLPQAGSTFAFTFERPGAYAYFCEVHPSMTADVVVE